MPSFNHHFDCLLCCYESLRRRRAKFLTSSCFCAPLHGSFPCSRRRITCAQLSTWDGLFWQSQQFLLDFESHNWLSYHRGCFDRDHSLRTPFQWVSTLAIWSSLQNRCTRCAPTCTPHWNPLGLKLLNCLCSRFELVRFPVTALPKCLDSGSWVGIWLHARRFHLLCW